MSEVPNVGDMVAEFLQQIDVEAAFGVISVHNIPMLDAIGRRNSIRFVTARGEAGAGHMADAYARVSGRLGVLFTSTGPGAANAAGALVEADFGGSPLLHITGQTATANIDRRQGAVHDVRDQLGMLKSVSKAAYRVRSPESALGVLVRAATEALTAPMGPVSVEIPADIQRAPLPRSRTLEDFTLPVPPPMPPDPRTLDKIADMLAASKRPLLWLGRGATHAGDAARRLMNLGVPVITSWSGRGTVPEDQPLTLAALGSTPEVEAFYPSVDLMIVAGSRLRGHETRDTTMPLPSKRVHIDVDADADGRTYASELFLCADSSLALAGLADRVADRLTIELGYADEIGTLKTKATEAYRDYLGPYRSFPGDLREAMPRDAVWVRDITLNNSTWGNRIFPLYDPHDNVYPVGAGIGPGLPFGIGAALAATGRKVVCMCGDGAVGLSLAELWTAAQEKVDVVFLVMNDQGYGVIKHIQDSLNGGRRLYGDIRGPDLAGLATLTGMPYHRVERAEELGPAVRKCLEGNGPSLVEVDMASIGTFPPYYAAPPYIAKSK